MARPALKVAAAMERLRESLWLIPGLMVAFAAALAGLLITADAPAPEFPLRRILLPASADGALPVLQVIAASVITVTSVVFSLTVVALQITAGNYSPRALRTFLRDLGTQFVLGTFLATFVYSFLVLQNVQSLSDDGDPWLPQLAFTAVPGFVLASLIALVFFIHHVTQAVRVEFILHEVLQENLKSIDTVHPDEGRSDKKRPREVLPEDAVEVTSRDTGFVQQFGFEQLLEELVKCDAVGVFRPSVGDHVLEGTTLGWVWQRDGSRADDEIHDAFRAAVQVGRERSMNHDVAFGIRQLVDIAVRALSPGVNDPNTAVSTLLHLSIVYRKLLTRRVGPITVSDDDGIGRIMVPYPSLAEYLAIMVQQVAHYGRADVMVVLRLLRELGELKSLADSADHGVFDDAIDKVMEEAERGLDLESNLDLVRQVGRDARDPTFQFTHYTAAG